tara:strand:- start:3860 stop:4168 length:309 start_codon:yes stop_codon:yes gene_type:complete
MRNAVMLLEKVLNDTVNNDKYRVRVHVTKHGNLPNRAPFIRKSYRQTTLQQFTDSGIGETPHTVGPLDIIYTVQAWHMKSENIAETQENLKKDLDVYLFSLR